VVYRPAFGIDYTQPQPYLAQGEQSRISDPSVLNPLRTSGQSMGHLGDIYRWLKREFTTYRAGGRTIISRAGLRCIRSSTISPNRNSPFWVQMVT
jgi:hypothetical protein